MRISDWSSDVCSSDLKYTTAKDTKALEALQDKAIRSVQSARVHIQVALVATILHMGKHGDWTVASRLVDGLGNTVNGKAIVQRSEERRVGQECVSTCRSRWSP